MFQKVWSAGIWGIDGFLVSVEADAHEGLPGFHLTGNLSQETKEAQERVWLALKNGKFRLPPKKIMVNLSPADIRKEGTAYDLAIAVAVLGAFGLIGPDLLDSAMIVGELGLSGEVKPIRGALSLVTAAKDQNLKCCFLPKENAREGSVIEGIQVVSVSHIRELAEMLRNPDQIHPIQGQPWEELKEGLSHGYDLDFSDLNGQAVIRRATEVAVAGRHNILYIGCAGSGKTMAARRIPTILPPLSRDESIAISKIYSVSGLLPEGVPLMTNRPFRSPHHTITPTALAGGGMIPRPGEISLASGGVLFLDELPEFSGKAIEILRQPLEDRTVTISRLYGACTFPANTMVAAAMNPCPCGFYPDRTQCRCSPWQVKRYIGTVSKPILDRIDVTVEAAPVAYEEFRCKGENENSEAIRKRVVKAQQIQKERFQIQNHDGSNQNQKEKAKIWFNGEMGVKEIEMYCRLNGPEEAYLKEIYRQMKLSARGCHKILKVARTIADLEGKEEISKEHLGEAVRYRSLEEKYWHTAEE
ncbi:MAG: YifB family Mg chelatase-like AAA ATPase [Lachnospiraceae bacterium]|jgi:magnesium chelatase family protein|nr:YifB family Mg chelatase-like AAA ATPase [Lachnospiraceae bacterium]